MAAKPDTFHRQIGFVLSHEQCSVPELIELGVAAEQAGFDLISASDHFQPWQANQGHAGFAWITLGALGQRTQRIQMGTMVTCPTFRYSPAVVAQAFATLGQLYPGRIFLGVGSGEALNEQAAAGIWPAWRERSERLGEAIELIRELWKGEAIRHHGAYYHVHARLYDVPRIPVPIFVAANGPKAMARASRLADGLITDPETFKANGDQFNAAGNGVRPVIMEQFVVIGDEQDAQAPAERWRFIPNAWDRYVDMPDPQAIQDEAARDVPIDEVLKEWTVSPDPQVHIDALERTFAAGATTILVHCAAEDQRGAIDFYAKHVLPRVRKGVAAS